VTLCACAVRSESLGIVDRPSMMYEVEITPSIARASGIANPAAKVPLVLRLRLLLRMTTLYVSLISFFPWEVVG
jgi:hypothetical protein